ncbi:MAG TPA: hypothetical protein VKV19_08970 [Ktedonobacteraceae bacterium]|nr:hypothetical protein [Ktedonobacteraceae bacterium]
MRTSPTEAFRNAGEQRLLPPGDIDKAGPVDARRLYSYPHPASC